MYDVIKQHAIENLWCAPDQDKQFVFQPAKISSAAGNKNTIKVMWDIYKLPTRNVRYHVYQVGQIHPFLIGLVDELSTIPSTAYIGATAPPTPTEGSLWYKTPPNNLYRYTSGQWVITRTNNNWFSNPTSPSSSEQYSSNAAWVKLSDICNIENLVVDIYNNSGIQMPRHTSYVMVTADKNLLFAVRDQPAIMPNLNTIPLFFRLYSNAFFLDPRSNGFNHRIYTEGKIVTDYTDIFNYRQYMESFITSRGALFIYVNGVFVHNCSADTAKPGDLVEFYYDSTVVRTVEIPIKDMETFQSDVNLDNKIKYLITYPESGENDSIDYFDDMDFYLIRKTNINDPTQFKGCYYHKNWKDCVRMLTHKDYSIPAAYVQGYVDDHSFFDSSDDVVLKLYIRESGNDRVLVNEHNRIKELYKLSDAQVTGAMVGLNSTLINWRAETLENSDYVRVMRSTLKNITKLMVQNAYGYNAIAKIIADTPSPVEIISSSPTVELPVGLRTNSAIYEYDVNGKLLSYWQHDNDYNYWPHNLNTTLVEGVMGLPTNHLDMVFGQQIVTINPYYSYRMYKTRLIAGIPQADEWIDVTGTNDYHISGNTLTWSVDMDYYYTCVKSDAVVLAYSFDISHDDNLLMFTIANEETHDAVTLTKTLEIPVGKLDIWLNGNYLIENLDYYIRWPDVVVVNKQYLNVEDGAPFTNQHFDIRGTGFCSSDLKVEPAAEFGFVVNGLLSTNNRFDVRDDKVLHFTIEGAIKQRSDLVFDEDTAALSVPGIRNGAPYVIKDIIVPMRDATIADTYVLRAQSQEVDRNVSFYMSQYLPQPNPQYPNIIPHLYNVYSPFASKIIHDLINGVLVLPGIQGHYSEMDIRSWLTSYEWLLDYDPCRKVVNTNYVSIHPHPLYVNMTLNVYEYAFMERVITFYLSNKVDLSIFVSMEI